MCVWGEGGIRLELGVGCVEEGWVVWRRGGLVAVVCA